MTNSPSGSDRVLIYARMSEDDFALGLGVDRQYEGGRDMAAARGWTVVAELHDNDISALKGAHRPGYQEVVRLVREGEVERIIVWQSSRLFRNRVERAQAIEDFARAKIIINAVKGPEFDLTTAYGRGQFGLLGEFDTMESEVKSERVLAANLQRVAKGLPSGGLGYGWRKKAGEYVLEEAEAAVVREIVDRLLEGQTLRTITRDLNEREVPSPELAWWNSTTDERREARLRKGGKVPTGEWGKTSVKKLAMRHSNVALRLHHRGQEDEQIVPGVWPPILERGRWERVCLLLSAPERRKNGIAHTGRVARPGAREHLLSWGVGECGVCHGMLRAVHRKTTTYGVPRRYYQCERHACVSRDRDMVDTWVRDHVVARLQRDDALSWATPDESLERNAAQKVEALQRRVRETEKAVEDGDMPPASGGRILARLADDLEVAEAEYRRLALRGSRDVLAAAAGPKAVQWWDTADVSQRRAVVEALLEKVVILPTTRGPGFKPEHVKILWRRADVPN